jgi:uncharacterized membrane protein
MFVYIIRYQSLRLARNLRVVDPKLLAVVKEVKESRVKIFYHNDIANNYNMPDSSEKKN